jgi:hypothetical protein
VWKSQQFHRRHDAGAHRIEMNIMTDLRESMTGLDQQCLVATLKRATNEPTKSIVAADPSSLQPLHPLAKVRLGQFDCQVKMITHHDLRVHPPPEALRRLP